MKLANLADRAVLLVDGKGVDVAEASEGRFGPDITTIYPHWEEFRAWAEGADLGAAGTIDVDPVRLGSPTPRPLQVFAIGLNYGDHADESGLARPEGLPPVFTKYASSITGPVSTVELPEGGHTDWEVELAVVIGRGGRRIPAADAWDHVAGLTIAQDLSERITQMLGTVPQFGFGKSFPGFTPVGPWLVTTDEFEDVDDLSLQCDVDGELMQDGSTADLLVDVPHLIEALSAVVTLCPGDLILTGTPSGVGMGRSPQRFLRPGEVVRSRIEGIGELVQTFVAEGA